VVLEWSLNGGTSVGGTANRAYSFNLNENAVVNVRWRAVRVYAGVTYNGAWSNTKTVNAGRPLKRNASQNFDYNKTAFRDQTIGETVNFVSGFGTVIDSYQFRNVDAVNSSLLANDTASLTLYLAGERDLVSLWAAGVASILPPLVRWLNPNDEGFGRHQ
jgi:hypothetical protein